MATMANIVVVFEKSKSRIGQLELEVVMLEKMLKKMQVGGGVMVYPQTMLNDSDLKLDHGVLQ